MSSTLPLNLIWLSQEEVPSDVLFYQASIQEYPTGPHEHFTSVTWPSSIDKISITIDKILATSPTSCHGVIVILLKSQLVFKKSYLQEVYVRAI